MGSTAFQSVFLSNLATAAANCKTRQVIASLSNDAIPSSAKIHKRKLGVFTAATHPSKFNDSTLTTTLSYRSCVEIHHICPASGTKLLR
jgi:hypothetical protein